ncbi:T-complex protein 1 subunit eta, partial [Trichinella sp. T6]
LKEILKGNWYGGYSAMHPRINGPGTIWLEYFSPQGRPYYYNSMTGETTWDRPPEMDVSASMKPASEPIGAMVKNGAETLTSEVAKTVPEAFNDGKPSSVQSSDSAPEATKTTVQDSVKQDKPRPISSNPVAGCSWCVVWTSDMKVFFYNPDTRMSVWERPPELYGRPDVDLLLSHPPEPKKTEVKKEAPPSQSKASVAQSETVSQTSVPKKAKHTADAKAESEQPAKTKQKEKQPQVKQPVNKPPDPAMEAEMKAAQERAQIPIEVRTKQFREMLQEKQVSAFSTWEKELHKIVFDPRYLLLTSKERKATFEEFIKEKAENERAEKKRKLKEAKANFAELLQEADITGKTMFSEFASEYGNDSRFKALEKSRERESLFDDFVRDIRNKEREEKHALRAKQKEAFFALLREQEGITRRSRWVDFKKELSSDARYIAVEKSSLREDWFIDYCRDLPREDRPTDGKSAKRDHSRTKAAGSKGDDAKDNKDRSKDTESRNEKETSRAEERFMKEEAPKDKQHSKDKPLKDSSKQTENRKRKSESSSSNEERIVDNKKVRMAYKEEEDNDDHDDDDDDDDEEEDDDDGDEDEQEEEKECRNAATVTRQEQSRTEERYEPDVKKNKLPLGEESDEEISAEGHFKMLLVDLVTTTDVTWEESKKRLRKDERWKELSSLDRGQKEELFEEHLRELKRKYRTEYRQLLDQLPQFNLSCTWKEIKKLIRNDNRYSQYSSSDRVRGKIVSKIIIIVNYMYFMLVLFQKCEREFNDYLMEKLQNAVDNFIELLKETKIITHRSKKMMLESEQHLTDILSILENDERYLVLECVPSEREKVLERYLDQLEKAGTSKEISNFRLCDMRLNGDAGRRAREPVGQRSQVGSIIFRRTMSAPIILFKPGTEHAKGKRHIVGNIQACQAIADTIKTTLGPRGLDKMIVQSSGTTIISNDGATILKALEVALPAANVLVDLAKSQDAEIGDGTTTVVLLAAELLAMSKPFIDEGIHPQVIINAYRKASKYALQVVNDVAVDVKGESIEIGGKKGMSKKELLIKCACTTLSSKLVATQKQHFAELIVEAVMHLDDSMPLNMIGIKKIRGGSVDESELILGVAFKKTFSYAGFEMQPKTYVNPKIALLNIELELKAERENAEMQIKNVQEYQLIVDAEWQILYQKLEKLHALGVNVVLSRLPIGDVATQWFADRDMFCAGRVEALDLERTMAACGGSIISTVSNITPDMLGSCAMFQEKQIGGDRYNIFTGEAKAKTCTFLIRGGAEQFMEETERSIHDAIMIVRRALKNDKIVAGGGAFEMEVCNRLRKVALEIKDRDQFFVAAYAKAFEVIPRQLCFNAGMDSTKILNKLRELHAAGQPSAGINLAESNVVDNIEAFVWEPAIVKANAVAAATEAACLILSVDETIRTPSRSANIPKGMQ